MQNEVLAVSGLNVHFWDGETALYAVRDMGFRLQQGSRTAILGETGCGKSVMAMALFSLLPANAVVTGNAILNDENDILSLGARSLKKIRGTDMVLAPQNAMGYLNPVFSVGFHLKETIRRVNGLPKKHIADRALDLLAQVGFQKPTDVAVLFPHQLSGGMAQRVLLALSLAGNPSLVVADEPTKGLDIKARDRYLGLTRDLYPRAAFLMITHDLAAARSCERVMIMYAGRVVEDGPMEKVIGQPSHPYSKGLIAAHPSNGFTTIPGMPPQLTEEVVGCAFEPRCGLKTQVCCCAPPPEQHYSPQHRVNCHHA